MEPARLVALLELDDKSFMSGIDGATAKVAGFDSNMIQAGRTMAASSKAMSMLGMTAADAGGNIGGAAGAVAKLISAFTANPIYAVISGIVILTTKLATDFKEAADAAIAKTQALNEKFKEQQKILHENLGFGKKDEYGDKIRGLSQSGNTAGLRAESEAAKQRAADAFNKSVATNRMYVNGNATEEQDRAARHAYGIAKKNAKIAEAAYREQSKKQDEIDKKARQERSERSRKQYEMQVQAEMDAEDAAEAERAKKAERIVAIKAKGMAAIADAQAGNGVSIRNWGSDSVTRIGGQIGSQNSPQLRTLDRTLQIQKQIKEIQSETRDLLREALAQ